MAEDHPPPETLVEERQELMVSPLGGHQTLRTAHFLKPSSIEDIPPFSLPQSPNFSPIPKTRLQIKFRGTRNPLKKWETWVDHLLPTHGQIWEKAGILEAIMASKYQIMRRNELVIALAERWSPETNTFIFPWGESTLTLEDMKVLGGYSALGSPVFTPLKTKDLTMVKESLCKAHKEIRLGEAGAATQSAWMEHFMDSGNSFEHEAFLALWLTRYVLPTTYDTVSRTVFPVAIHLSRGTPIALAPAVLASIYRDLSLLKRSLVSSLSLDGPESGKFTVEVWAPFQLVQVWAWERFPTLRPSPNLIVTGEPRLALWHRVTYLKVENERKELDSAGNRFQWRPYAVAVRSWGFSEFYKENEEWALVKSDMNRELIALPLYMRPSELVGLNCIEQYLPHRVSMQFGIDQDIPGHVPRFNESNEAAWKNYCRPITDDKLYIPARGFVADVTARYFSWRARPGLAHTDAIKKDMASKCYSRKKKRLTEIRGGNEAYDGPLISSDVDEDEEDNLTIGELLNQDKKKRKTINDGLTAHNKPRPQSSSLLSQGLQEQNFRSMKALNQTTQENISIDDTDNNDLRRNANGEDQGKGLKGDGKSISGNSASEGLQKGNLGREKDLDETNKGSLSVEDANETELNGEEKGNDGLTGDDKPLCVISISSSSSSDGLTKGDFGRMNNVDETKHDIVSIEDDADTNELNSSFEKTKEGREGTSITSEVRKLRLYVEARVTKLERLVDWLEAGNLDLGQSDNPIFDL